MRSPFLLRFIKTFYATACVIRESWIVRGTCPQLFSGNSGLTLPLVSPLFSLFPLFYSRRSIAGPPTLPDSSSSRSLLLSVYLSLSVSFSLTLSLSHSLSLCLSLALHDPWLTSVYFALRARRSMKPHRCRNGNVYTYRKWPINPARAADGFRYCQWSGCVKKKRASFPPD